MNKIIYLDNNATTPIAPDVLTAMMPYFANIYANPSSPHRGGIEAERAVKSARHILASHLQAEDEEIIFTSGGTESINLGIKGAALAMKRQGQHIITASTEHEAVLASINNLTQMGFTVSFVEVDKEGYVNPQAVQTLMTPETILVSVMQVNNELGTINPVAEIARVVKTINKNTRVFVDGVQALGKLKISLADIDLYAMSAHKLQGPKGVGALYLKQGTPLQTCMHGGGQENNRRSGTENVPGIVGFSSAVQLAYQRLEKTYSHWQALKTYFVEQLQRLPQVIINSPAVGLPNTVNVSFIGVPSEVMMHALGAKGIYVSSGSACQNGKPSHVLKAIKLSTAEWQSAIRFSFSWEQTFEEMEYVVRIINEILHNVRI